MTRIEELDPFDPLGAIRIQSDEGRELLERRVFLDDWFRGLVSGLRSICSGEGEVAVDLGSERDPLIFSANANSAILQYKNHELPISDIAGFESALREAIIEFTEHYRTHRNWSKCKGLAGLREWALNKPAG